MTSPPLESIPGDLLAYKELEPDSMLHGYEITAERRTCANEKLRAKLRNNPYYTADGQLYTVKKREVLWGITMLPQNLVLRNIDEAYQQLTQTHNYFPLTEEAEVSFTHADTSVVDIKGLKLVKDNDEYGHFVIDSRKSEKLNSQQKKVAVRLFGPDKESFGLNMEMLEKARISPFVFVPMPDYVQDRLKSEDKQYLGRASWLYDFNNDSYFGAVGRGVSNHSRVRGVRRASEASQREEKSPEGRAPEITGAPSVPSAASKLRAFSLEQLLACLGDDVAPSVRPRVEERYRNLFKR